MLKVSMEKELMLSEVPFTILRVSNVYGPGQPHGRGQGVIAEWKYAIENGYDIKVFGSLETFRDYIYIEDLCEGIYTILQNFGDSQVLNIGSGEPTPLSRILEIFTEFKSEESQVVLSQGRNTDRKGYFLDIDRIKTLYKWNPKISIENGIKMTIVDSNG
jgi:UDP-glucose 4-epimerase